MQDVIAFPDVRTEAQLEGQLNASLMISEIAEMLYQARCFWIGGQTLRWHELTAMQKFDYRREVENLIRGRE